MICGERSDQAGRFCTGCVGPVAADGPSGASIDIGRADVRPLRLLQWPITGLLLAASAVAGMRSAALWLDLTDVWRARREHGVERLAKLAPVDQHLVIVGAVVVCAVGLLWLAWWAVAYANLRPLGVRPRNTPAWAVAAWLVPGVDLVLPQQVADELWKGSDPWAPLGWRARRRGRRAGVVRCWWVSWCAAIALLIGAEVLLAVLPGRDPAMRATGDLAVDALLIASALLTAVAGLAATALITGVTARQDARARLLVQAGLVPSP